MVASAVPSPAENVRPVVPDNVSVPLTTVRVAWMAYGPASSLMEMALPPPVENTSVVSFAVLWAAGTVLTGASLVPLT